MKLLFIQTGRTADRRMADLTAEYAARIGHYVPFETLTVPDLRNTRTLTQKQQKEREGEGIARLLKEGDFVILLDEHGRELRSMELARYLQQKMNASWKRIVFIIGGPYGFSKDIYARANEKLSLSRLTFSHQMVRLFFTEQIYRAMTILKGEPYHHE